MNGKILYFRRGTLSLDGCTVNDFNDRIEDRSLGRRSGEDRRARVLAEAKAHRCSGTWGWVRFLMGPSTICAAEGAPSINQTDSGRGKHKSEASGNHCICKHRKFTRYGRTTDSTVRKNRYERLVSIEKKKNGIERCGEIFHVL